MSAGIFGWVEVTQGALLPSGRFIPQHWRGIVDASVLLDGENPRGSSVIFGIGIGGGEEQFAGFEPIAYGRGLPEDVSERVQQEATATGQEFDHTWVTLAELRTVDWDEVSPEDGSTRRRDNLGPHWWVLFRVMDSLAACFSEHGVRLVVWVIW